MRSLTDKYDLIGSLEKLALEESRLHIVYRDSRWYLIKENGGKATYSHRDIRRVKTYAFRAMAKSGFSELILHNEDGTVSEIMTYREIMGQLAKIANNQTRENRLKKA